VQDFVHQQYHKLSIIHHSKRIRSILSISPPPPGQALAIPYVVISASEINATYREFIDWNYPGKFSHLFPSIETQLAGTSVCCFCKGGTPSKILGPCNPSKVLNDMRELDGPSLMVTGSPCNPYSTQRTKRFAVDSVRNHSLFDVTDKSTISLLKQYEPKKWLFEQVWGFTMPFSTATKETPKDRFLGTSFPSWILDSRLNF